MDRSFNLQLHLRWLRPFLGLVFQKLNKSVWRGDFHEIIWWSVRQWKCALTLILSSAWENRVVAEIRPYRRPRYRSRSACYWSMEWGVMIDIMVNSLTGHIIGSCANNEHLMHRQVDRQRAVAVSPSCPQRCIERLVRTYAGVVGEV